MIYVERMPMWWMLEFVLQTSDVFYFLDPLGIGIKFQ